MDCVAEDKSGMVKNPTFIIAIVAHLTVSAKRSTITVFSNSKEERMIKYDRIYGFGQSHFHSQPHNFPCFWTNNIMKFDRRI